MNDVSRRALDAPILRNLRGYEYWILIVLAVLLIFGIAWDLGDQPTYEKHRALALIVGWILFLACMIPAVVRCGNEGYKSVWPVCSVTLFLIISSVFVFYIVFFWLANPSGAIATNAADSAQDKLLSIPPIFVGVGIACLGWYVHFQATAKNHRTNNSFTLVVQTRTSKEFLDRTGALARVYPWGCPVPKDDLHLSKHAALLELDRIVAAGGATVEQIRDLDKARALNALNYLLNFYEFMAVGIHEKDLNEDIIYNTLGVTVTSTFDRAKEYVKYSRDQGQNLAFISLEALSKSWTDRLLNDKHSIERKGANGG